MKYKFRLVSVEIINISFFFKQRTYPTCLPSLSIGKRLQEQGTLRVSRINVQRNVRGMSGFRRELCIFSDDPSKMSSNFYSLLPGEKYFYIDIANNLLQKQ